MKTKKESRNGWRTRISAGMPRNGCRKRLRKCRRTIRLTGSTRNSTKVSSVTTGTSRPLWNTSPTACIWQGFAGTPHKRRRGIWWVFVHVFMQGHYTHVFSEHFDPLLDELQDCIIPMLHDEYVRRLNSEKRGRQWS